MIRINAKKEKLTEYIMPNEVEITNISDITINKSQLIQYVFTKIITNKFKIEISAVQNIELNHNKICGRMLTYRDDEKNFNLLFQ